MSSSSRFTHITSELEKLGIISPEQAARDKLVTAIGLKGIAAGRAAAFIDRARKMQYDRLAALREVNKAISKWDTDNLRSVRYDLEKRGTSEGGAANEQPWNRLFYPYGWEQKYEEAAEKAMRLLSDSRHEPSPWSARSVLVGAHATLNGTWEDGPFGKVAKQLAHYAQKYFPQYGKAER